MPTTPRDFLRDARVVGGITFLSRILGMAREVVAAAAFGAGPVWSAFTLAFTIPNLFRKLFGEGAISAAFIPIYARLAETYDPEAPRFARQAVNLLVAILALITLVGELLLAAVLVVGAGRDDYRLAVVLTMVMLPYVVLICGAAFLGGILNVHGRFAMPAAASVVLNACLIAAVAGTWFAFDLSDSDARARATLVIAAAVVASGFIQVAMLLPGLRRVGFAFDPLAGTWSDTTRRMVTLGIPVALSAAVLQVSVLLDKGVGFFLAAAEGDVPGGLTPLAAGAAARLNWAQFLYQFPLGIFAVALATAIFPTLSRSAAGGGGEGGGGAGRNDVFRGIVRRGVEASLYIGLPASVGLVLVAHDATRVLFERGRFTPFDTMLVAAGVAVYASAVWAFSLQQIVNRAFFALEETRIPLYWAGGNLAINLAVELPLIWLLPRPFGEIGLAVGTLVSFSIQSVVMLAILSRRVGGLGLRKSVRPVAVMLAATVIMTLACLPVRLIDGDDTAASVLRLVLTLSVGGGVYLVAASVMGGLRPPRRTHSPA